MIRPSPLLALLFALACAGRQDPPTTPEGRVREMPAPARIVDLRTGEEVDELTMLADLRGARAIYLGESHDDTLDHAMQYRLLRELHRQDGALVLGMEMFQRPYQAVLDDWTAGRLDEEALRRRTEWDTRWGFDIRLYRPMLEFARARGVPVIALNARRELSRAVAMSGLEGLDEALRADVPAELDLEDEAHRALVMEALAEHPHGADEAALERMYEAQVLWDETMAERVAAALEAGASRIVVLAGSMHVRAGLGIP
ncbi:MAG TPA: ChaN family lipoprotein, partial [Polyangiaceae bacterium LLY-WYZ-15_(1-7)]|nr:ChaN family lipoprotein [Polyangiaceae bacterium LLY-WYZ-15_(1-7)]